MDALLTERTAERLTQALRDRGIDGRVEVGEVPTPAAPQEPRVWIPTDDEFEGSSVGFIPAPALEAIGNDLIGRHADLSGLHHADIAFVWKRAGGKSKGKPTLGQCQKPSGLLAHFSRCDFVIWAAADHCRDFGFGGRQIEALVYHELCHCDWEEDDEGEIVWTVKGHDWAGFRSELERYGAWTADARFVAPAFRQIALPQ